MTEMESLPFIFEQQELVEAHHEYYARLETVRENISKKQEIENNFEEIKQLREKGFASEEVAELEEELHSLGGWYKKSTEFLASQREFSMKVLFVKRGSDNEEEYTEQFLQE